MGQLGGLATTWRKHISKWLVASTCHGPGIFISKGIFILLKYLLYCGGLKYSLILPLRFYIKISSVVLRKVAVEVDFMVVVLWFTQIFVHMENRNIINKKKTSKNSRNIIDT